MDSFEHEYSWTQQDVDNVLLTGSLDALKDALEFGPEGIRQLIVDRAVELHVPDNNKLAACFDDKIDTEIVDEICTYNPQHIVFTDRSFNIDEDKINTVEKIKNLSHNTKLIIL